MKVIVCQRGARRRYMVATLLYRAGMLSALYTDSTESSFLGTIGKFFPGFIQPKIIKKLLNRKIIDIPKELINNSDILFWQKILKQPLDMSKQYIKWGLKDCDAVYSFYGEDKDFLYYAKNKRKKIIVDVMSHPLMNSIYAKDFQNSKEYLFDIQELYKQNEEQIKHSKEIFDMADYLIVPSNWIRDGVLEISSKLEKKIVKIPYGSSIDYTNKEPKTKLGRIIFVGHGIFTKGLHHLSEKAKQIKSMIPYAELRIIGVTKDDGQVLKNHEILNFIGNVPLNQMSEEYLLADVLVMPSLSEGQSGAVLEALAAGVPVVITKQSGIDITHGKEGYQYDSKEYDCLPKLLSDIISNRELRNEMSRNAKEFAKDFSMEHWQKRLVNFLNSIQ